MTESELYHYGVLGMRWGVRKDNNAGGGSSGWRLKPRKKPVQLSQDARVVNKLKTKQANQLNTHELRKVSNRLRLEKDFHDYDPSLGARRSTANSLTNRIRYGGNSKTISQDAREVSELRKKRVYEMSNAELRKVTERQQLEKTYSKLNPTLAAKGMAYVTAAVATIKTLNDVYKMSKPYIKRGKSLIEQLGNR